MENINYRENACVRCFESDRQNYCFKEAHLDTTDRNISIWQMGGTSEITV